MSQQLINAIADYENYIQNKGIDEEIIDAYVQACTVAIKTENDRKYGLGISARAKELIEQLVEKLNASDILTQYDIAEDI